jgi:hypothetical protein
MAVQRNTKKATHAEPESKYSKEVVQEALQLAFVLKGHIKRAQKYFLAIGRELAEVRDKKMYLVLSHPNMADFSREHLGLSQTSVYRYLQVFDWVSKKHPEWMKEGYKGVIPDLTDIPILIEIEKELERKDLDPDSQKALKDMLAKALEGKLDAKAFNAYRRRRNAAKDGLKSYLSSLRSARRRGAEMKNMPAEVISNLDEAIAALENAMDLHRAAVALEQGPAGVERRGKCVA